LTTFRLRPRAGVPRARSLCGTGHESRITNHESRGVIFLVTMKKWIKDRVHAYEKMRFDQEPIRAKLPFEWGLEHIGGDAQERDPRGYLERFVEETVAESDAWYASRPAQDYKLDGNVLTFTSAIESPWAENNRVYGQFFPAIQRTNGNGARAAKNKGRAVVVLAQWNARWDEQQGVCRWLNKLGITAVKMSLPYHDRRAIPGHRRADHLVSPNIGLTLHANRQAVVDVRATLRWLEQQGYDRLGILGTSIGSCIGFITMCHEPAVRAGAFLHASMYFGDVVANGLTTVNVWEQMAEHVTPEELRRYWAPISPLPYLNKLPGRDLKTLLITGKYDPTFWPEFTDELFANMRREGIKFASLRLPCGHYSLGVTPFKHVAGYRFGKFLANALA
ncbi:MAG TPA: prolyl oligopeptidase family serine peptidase, partial [Candidatus Dormibacteraeota bacterium]|nr:prolyl oligopeptidase family serine peptidase [Candidatus Dormibacteraeota bacterium]